MLDPVVEAAVCNASWCDAVCRAQGLRTQWGDDAWTVAQRSPDGYPDAVTLSPGATAHEVLRRVEGGAGCSVKDSFAVLDLEPLGFQPLFWATWIRRSADSAVRLATLDWREAQTPAELEQWSHGHDLDVFGSALLDVDDLRFFFTGPGVEAGFALNVAGGVVGVSNVVAGGADPVVVWSDLITVAAASYPGLDLAGYERGDDLVACR